MATYKNDVIPKLEGAARLAAEQEMCKETAIMHPEADLSGEEKQSESQLSDGVAGLSPVPKNTINSDITSGEESDDESSDVEPADFSKNLYSDYEENSDSNSDKTLTLSDSDDDDMVP